VVPQAKRDDLMLAATELVTNAYNAGANTVDVELRTPPPYLELHVTDNAPGVPLIGHQTVNDTSGRGLLILAALAEQWGFRIEAIGKTVWARFGL
jgi:signal transduction histidine kinase